MCPPAQPSPPAEIGKYWSEEQIISSLYEYTRGSNLPNNVLADSSPFQFSPSNLPEGIWYLINTNEKKDSIFGFWKPKGEACKIYTNSVVNGWRTTLEYFKGEPPHGQRTDWLMQEYTITHTDILHSKDKPKESRSLCQFFLCSGCSSKSDMQPDNCKTVIELEKINSLSSNTNVISDQDHISESKGEHDEEWVPVEADKIPDLPPQVLPELECFLTGDYLELNDLEDDPESHSSSSQNSSCPSKLSDEYFDSLALLRDLEDDDSIYVQPKQSGSKYSFTTSVKPYDVVLQQSSTGSLLDSTRSTNLVEGSQTDPTVHGTMTNNRVVENTAKRNTPETRNEGTSNLYDTITPSMSDKNANPRGEKKTGGGGTMKKLKMYFCLTPFD